jgi:CheY-like chemotaxis protein
MNLFGNSLKFTSDGYVHVILRQLPLSDGDPNKVKVELSVLDTGKGISQEFLKNQLFHPFSQENPLQTGTGLGLAIVSSIVTSENVGGNVDVWSEEGVGTEIKVTFLAEVPQDSVNNLSTEMQPFKVEDGDTLPSIALLGFSEPHRGTELLKNTFCTYLTTWWGFQIVDDGDIVLLNEETRPVVSATEARDISRPFIILSSARGNPMIMSIASDHERIGGFCRILYKPSGPSRLRAVLKLGVHALAISKSRSRVSSIASDAEPSILSPLDDRRSSNSSIFRRNSEETHLKRTNRPSLSIRSTTISEIPSLFKLAPAAGGLPNSVNHAEPDTPTPTISVGTGGTLLKASLGSLTSERRFRILVVEDNSILRNLLLKWLSNKGYDLCAAVDGRQGVTVFEQDGPFDVVLLDLSMPVLDGIGATSEIRAIEDRMKRESLTDIPRCRILALTGMSSLEDKRRAFEAGVDGYLVKPVAFKTLDEMFHKLGVS